MMGCNGFSWGVMGAGVWWFGSVKLASCKSTVCLFTGWRVSVAMFLMHPLPSTSYDPLNGIFIGISLFPPAFHLVASPSDAGLWGIVTRSMDPIGALWCSLYCRVDFPNSLLGDGRKWKSIITSPFNLSRGSSIDYEKKLCASTSQKLYSSRPTLTRAIDVDHQSTDKTYRVQCIQV